MLGCEGDGPDASTAANIHDALRLGDRSTVKTVMLDEPHAMLQICGYGSVDISVSSVQTARFVVEDDVHTQAAGFSLDLLSTLSLHPLDPSSSSRDVGFSHTSPNGFART